MHLVKVLICNNLNEHRPIDADNGWCSNKRKPNEPEVVITTGNSNNFFRTVHTYTDTSVDVYFALSVLSIMATHIFKK